MNRVNGAQSMTVQDPVAGVTREIVRFDGIDPRWVNPGCNPVAYFSYVGSEGALRAAGIIADSTRLPVRPQYGRRHGGEKVTMLLDRRLCVTLDPELACARDLAFQAFLSVAGGANHG